MSDCLLCRIVAGEEEATFVYRAQGVIGIRDKFPLAPIHVLVFPERHIASAHEISDQDVTLLFASFWASKKIAEDEGIADGYRIATNIGERGGQAIPHLHFHVLGGRQLGRPDSSDSLETA